MLTANVRIVVKYVLVSTAIRAFFLTFQFITALWHVYLVSGKQPQAFVLCSNSLADTRAQVAFIFSDIPIFITFTAC